MSIIDSIRTFFRRGQVVSSEYGLPFANFGFCNHDFAQVIWYNICDILTDLIEDVEITSRSGESVLTESGAKFFAFKMFVYTEGKRILQQLYDYGFVVVAYNRERKLFWQMKSSEYSERSEAGTSYIEPHDQTNVVYVMKSAAFAVYGKSDKAMCRGWLNFLDDVLNGSATVSKRLGAVVVASPKNLTNAPTSIVLTDEQKKKLEEDISKSYGALTNQSNVMLLPREMSWQVINLAGLDMKMQEKSKLAILSIADRIKVPANQIAIIDAQSSRTLSNGGEIREGDKLKYKSFRRLFERTFADMARYYSVQMDYMINGEPIGESAEVKV